MVEGNPYKDPDIVYLKSAGFDVMALITADISPSARRVVYAMVPAFVRLVRKVECEAQVTSKANTDNKANPGKE